MKLIIETDNIDEARAILRDLHFDTVELMPDKEERVAVSIRDTLKKLGIYPNLKGYGYIEEALNIASKNKDILVGGITKLLYPEIAKRRNAPIQSVERCIRGAIKVGYAKGDEKFYNKIFGDTHKRKDTPTVSEFISTVADYLTCTNKLT